MTISTHALSKDSVVALVGLLLCFFSRPLCAQSEVTRVTVITHGFTAGGTLSTDWKEFALRVRKRSGGTVYVNNAKGVWQKLIPNKALTKKGLTNGTGGTNEHKIFLYDWAASSNNLADGYLEGSADHLFALLCNTEIGNIFDNQYRIHFIGHSRGTILLLQVAHRVARYFPSRKIDHFTLLDPHPAAQSMNDVSGSSENLSLPGVYGTPSISFFNKCLGFDNIGTTRIRLPVNILKADEYYRQDGLYEVCSLKENAYKLDAGDFDGVPVEGLGIPSSGLFYPNGKFRRKLNNSLLGGLLVHSSVWQWYLGTIDWNVAEGNSNWFATETYPSAILPHLKILEEPSNENENRVTTGYYYSYEGGGYQSLSTVAASTQVSLDDMNARTINRTGETLTAIYNRVFKYNTNLFQYIVPGWLSGNGGQSSRIKVNAGAAVVLSGKEFKHSYFYIPPGAKKLVVKAKANVTNSTSGPGQVAGMPSSQLQIKFYDANANSTAFIKKSNGTSEGGVQPLGDAQGTYSWTIPSALIGQVGTFGISCIGGSSITVSEVSLSDGNQNMRIAQTAVAVASAASPISSYFDFPVTYDVSPTPLIRGLQPNSFKANITNSLPTTWAGTLTMTWRKVDGEGRGIPLVSKGVSLRPNATVTLDRGTQQIISEVGEYVLAIYANNDAEPIDRYYFFVEEEPEIANVTVGLTPGGSNFTFGDVTVGTSKTQLFTIKNTSSAPVNITNYALSGAGFVPGVNTCCGTLAPDQSYDIPVLFQPGTQATYTGQLQLNGTFTDAPITISLTGAGIVAVPPADGCLEASNSSITIQSGNTDAPKQQFFTLTNTSQTGAVKVTGIRFEGPDASAFTYDANLFEVPSTLSPRLATGFLISFVPSQPANRAYTTTLVISTANPTCPEFRIPVTATHTPSQLTWLSPGVDQTFEASVGNSIPLQWQGFVPNTTLGPAALDIQYSTDEGVTWISRTDGAGQTCTTGHLNNQLNTIYFNVETFAGKAIQFRIKPCYETATPWKYSPVCHSIQPGQITLQLNSPNGYEVLAGGSKVDIKWSNLIGYKLVDLAYTTNNGNSWQRIATGVSGQATTYPWQVPTGIKSSECRIRITASNISDESNENFTIQPALATPITQLNASITPAGCASVSNGKVHVQLVGGVPPYYVQWIEANVGVSTINANYVTTSIDRLNAGRNRCLVTDANNNKALFTFDIPQQANLTLKPIVTNAICNGANGSIALNVSGDFQFPYTATLVSKSAVVGTGTNRLFQGLSAGYYEVSFTNYDGCTQNFVVQVESSPGTLFSLSAISQNTTCGASTGSISLAIGTAQNPTFLWSTGATAQQIVNLAAGQYSVRVTDASGCLQTLTADVLIGGAWTGTDLGNYKANPSAEIMGGKLFFPHVPATGASRVGILTIPGHLYDFIAYVHPTQPTWTPTIRHVSVSSGKLAVGIDFGSEYHFALYDAASKQLLQRFIRNNGNASFYVNKMTLIGDLLYICTASKTIEVYSLALQRLVTTIILSESAPDLVVDDTSNKAYVICYDNSLKVLNLTTNAISQSVPLTRGGYRIAKVGNKLSIVTQNSTGTSSYIDLYDPTSLVQIGSILVGAPTYNSMASDGQNFLFYSSTNNKKIQIIDLNKAGVIAESSFADFAMSLAYDPTTNRVYSAGSNSIKYLENTGISVSGHKQDTSCGLSTGAVSLTVPSDGRTFTYHWSTGATTKDIQGLLGGIYSVTVSAVGACSTILSFSVNQNTSPNTATAIMPSASTICTGATVLLQAMANQTYQWLKDGNPVSGATAQTYLASQPGNYAVRLTNSNSCSALSQEVRISVVAAPVANFTYTVSNNVVTFSNSSNSAIRFVWTLGDNTTSSLYSPVKSYSLNGTYQVTLQAINDCGVISQLTRTISIGCFPTATLSGSQSIVAGQRATLQVTFTGSTPWSFSLSPGGSYSVTTSPFSFTVLPALNTSYWLLGISNACGSGSTSGTAIVSVSTITPPACISMVSVRTGNWTDSPTWSCNRVPASTDALTISAGHVVTIPAGMTATARTVYTVGKLIYGSGARLILGQANSIDLTTGLVGYYPFSGNANDASNNANHGTVAGATLTTDRRGNANSAYAFGGYSNSGHIKVLNSPSLQFANTMTISLWYWLNTYSGMDGYGGNSTYGLHTLVAKDHDSGGFFSRVAGDAPNNAQNIHLSNTNTRFDVSGAFQGVTAHLNTWIHVVFVVSNSQVKLYKNGVLVSTSPLAAPATFPTANTRDLYFGKYRDSWYPLNGKLDDIRIYNRALTDSEVQALTSQ